MADTTTNGGLKPRRGSRKVGFLTRIGNVLTGDKGKPVGRRVRDPEGLRVLIRADRVNRRMTWAAYAAFLGVKLSTLHKIATGVHRATEITEATIRDVLDANP